MLRCLFSTYFHRSHVVKVNENPFSGSRVIPRDRKKLTVVFGNLAFIYKPKAGQDIRALEVDVIFVCLWSECLRYKLFYILNYLDLYRSLRIVVLVKSRRLR